MFGLSLLYVSVDMSDVTRILNAIGQGCAASTEQLLPLVYEELRTLASRKMALEKPGQTLQATALVHEAYLRLVGEQDCNWKNRGHFFAAAAEAMRRILVDNARRKHSLKRGAEHHKVDIDAALELIESPREDILALSEALDELEQADPRLAELVKLRYFAGLTMDQIAEIMGIGRRTADTYWSLGRAWLYRRVNPDDRG